MYFSTLQCLPTVQAIWLIYFTFRYNEQWEHDFLQEINFESEDKLPTAYISIHHTNCAFSIFGMQQYANKYTNTHLLFLLFQLRQFLFQLAHCSKLNCKYSNAKYTAKMLFCVNVIWDHEYPDKISHKSKQDCQCTVKYSRKVSQIHFNGYIHPLQR